MVYGMVDWIRIKKGSPTCAWVESENKTEAVDRVIRIRSNPL
jgi:hypothetical protein